MVGAGLCWGVRDSFGQQPGGRTLLRAGHVLDVKTWAEPTDQTVIMQGDKIVGVMSTNAVAAQAGVVYKGAGRLWRASKPG